MPTEDKPITPPVIDFAPFYESEEGKTKVAHEIVEGMKTFGFLYLVNHGVPHDMMDEAYSWCKKYFELPLEEKMKSNRPEDPSHHRGYSTIGRQKSLQMTTDPEEIKRLRMIPDVKESFDSGIEDPIACNFWPNETVIPGFKDFTAKYIETNTKIASNIMSAIAIGMGLDEDFFQSYHSKGDNSLRYLHYPPTDAGNLLNGKTERIGAHTDNGSLTLLSQDECGGLEVEHPTIKGVFIPVPYIEHSLVINIGDFLMRWSNDQLKSTLHRVQAPPRQEITGLTRVRYSIPFFVNANKDAIIDCLPGTYSETNPKKYDKVTCYEYLTQKFKSTLEPK